MVVGSTDREELGQRERKFEAARAVLDAAMARLQHDPKDEAHFEQACDAWANFPDTTHEYVRFVNEFHLDHQNYQYAEFVETCASLVELAIDYHQALLACLGVQARPERFTKILEVGEKFLSPLVRAVVLDGRPEILAQITKAACRGRYVLSGPDGNLSMPDAVSRYLPEIIAIAGLDAFEEPEAHLAEQWALDPTDTHVPRVRRALTDLAKIGADAARLALVDLSDDEEDGLANAAVAAASDDARWDKEGTNAERGRRNKRGHMRYAICAALAERLSRTARPQPLADLAALGVVALALGARGEGARFVLGGGGLLVQIKAARRQLDADVWRLVCEVGPNVMTGKSDADRLESLLVRTRDLFARVREAVAKTASKATKRKTRHDETTPRKSKTRKSPTTVEAKPLPPHKPEEEPWHTALPTLVDGDDASRQREVDVVLLVATKKELEAALRRLAKHDDRDVGVLRVHSERETYYLGRLGAHRVALTRCEAGQTGRGASILATSEAIKVWNPKAVIMPGIAFGAFPDKQKMGDVLVSTQVLCYENQRVGENETIQRGPNAEAGQTLINRFHNVLGWEFKRPDGLPCDSIPGPILSGEKLVDNSEFKLRLLRTYPQAIGGEMEGGGLYAAAARASVEWIVVKGICDWGENKGDAHHKLAAAAAVSLVESVLSSRTALDGLLRPSAGRGRTESGPGSRGRPEAASNATATGAGAIAVQGGITAGRDVVLASTLPAAGSRDVIAEFGRAVRRLDRDLSGLACLYASVEKGRTGSSSAIGSHLDGATCTRLGILTTEEGAMRDLYRRVGDQVAAGTQPDRAITVHLLEDVLELVQEVSEARPRLLVISKLLERSGNDPTSLELWVMNYGGAEAENVRVGFELPPGYALNKGAQGGGWEQPFERPERTVAVVNSGEAAYLGRVMRYEGSLRTDARVVGWRITAKGAKLATGGVSFEHASMERK